MEHREIIDGCLTEPFRCVLSGSSGVGKSSLLEKILLNKNGLYPRQFQKIIYCYGVETASQNLLKEHFKDRIQFYSGIPDGLLELCSEGDRDKVIVFEDLDEVVFESKLIAGIFKKFSHHLNLSVLTTTQDLNSKSSQRLTCFRNATVLILFKNYLDNTIPRTVAQKILPANPKKFLEVFDHATKSPHGYLAIFGTGPRSLQFRTDITCPAQKIFLI